MSGVATYAVGDRVVYWQPGVDAILASWSGGRGRADDGEERTTTILDVATDGQLFYYSTADGTMLTDADIRRKTEGE